MAPDDNKEDKALAGCVLVGFIAALILGVMLGIIYIKTGAIFPKW